MYDLAVNVGVDTGDSIQEALHFVLCHVCNKHYTDPEIRRIIINKIMKTVGCIMIIIL